MRRNIGKGRGASVMLSMALQDALIKLKTQERAMAARAEASERLADQIVGNGFHRRDDLAAHFLHAAEVVTDSCC